MNAKDYFSGIFLSRATDRREFLKQQIRCALLLAGGAAGFSFPKNLFGADLPDIGIAKGDPGSAARKAVDLIGGIRHFVQPGNKVVIKPNMSFSSNTEEASNTHPEVVKELVAMCKEAGAARIRVLDHPLRRKELCIEGVKKACEIFNEDMVHAVTSDNLYKEVRIPQGKQMKESDVMRDVLEADVLIAAPVAKSHGSAGVSLSMKGMMGLIWDRGIMHSRYDLHESIADLASLLRPALVVVDASRVLSSGGPAGPGKVLNMRTVIASADMVAADAQAVRMFEWYGKKFEPRQVKHIRIAHERGLGRMDVENLKIRQEQA
ncbi:MAG: DUF362 domain-containing protein [Desulfococcaceae bacterium]|jgi:uncharacterized protein (DUF362 family)|nr:DUF362 domain-containing protein [Desulfococcaceae bacterium]